MANSTKIEAVAQSVATGNIVTVEYDVTLADMLASECEDCVTTQGRIEYWGTDADGKEWRVHLATDVDD